jgi:hypothetical protein
MSSWQKRGGGSTRGERNAPRKRRPPWGGLLGGKPIKRQVWNFDERIDLGEEHVRRMQFFRMRLLKEHYNIIGGDDEYPIKGVVAADWLPWYQLALAIASEFDESLKIIDAPRPRKTARRWRGLEGYVLLQFVNDYRRASPGKSVQWYLAQLRRRSPKGYGSIPLRTLVVKYQEAKRYWDATKRTANRATTS